MTAVLLLKSLCGFLKETVADYSAAQGESGEYRRVEVFDWYLPFKNPKIQEKIDFPYISPRIVKGDESRDNRKDLNSIIQIEISFGVYSEGTLLNGFTHADGAYDVLNLMEHVRIALFKASILDKKYKLQDTYTWEIPEEQPYPLWVGLAQSFWKVQSVIPEYPGVDIFVNKVSLEK